MVTDTEMIEFMKNAVALYLNKNSALLHGVKSEISTDKNIVPIKCNDEILIPAEFFAKSINAEFKMTEKVAEIIYEKKIFSLNKLYSGVFYASVKELCDFFGKHLHIEDNGIIIYSDNDMEASLDWGNNLKMMRKISESYMFENISGN